MYNSRLGTHSQPSCVIFTRGIGGLCTCMVDNFSTSVKECYTETGIDILYCHITHFQKENNDCIIRLDLNTFFEVCKFRKKAGSVILLSHIISKIDQSCYAALLSMPHRHYFALRKLAWLVTLHVIYSGDICTHNVDRIAATSRTA